MPNASNKQKKKKGVVKPVVLANNVSPRPRNPTPRMKKPKVKGSHVSSVCSITNPFCPGAKGQRFTDGTGGNTLTEQIRGNYTIASNDAGYKAACFQPAAPYGYIIGNSGNVTQVFPAAYESYSASSMVATYATKYRIVSFGVIVRCVAAATDAAGLVTLGTAGKAQAPSGSLVTGNEKYNEVVIKAIQPGMEYSWISKPIGPTAREFVSVSTSTSVTETWTSLYIEVTGAKFSTNVINVEWFLNIEYQVGPASAVAVLAKPGPVSNVASHVSTKAVTHMGSFIEGGVAAVEEAVTSTVKKAISSVMDDPLEALGFMFGGL